MLKLLIKSLIFFAIIIALTKYTSSFIAPSQPLNKNDYMAILNDKHRIADSIKTPKMILVGGSNLAFGIDSKMLRKELGIPTANMGLHAGLGTDFLLNQAKYIAKENDMIMLSIEFFLPTKGNYRLQEFTGQVYGYGKKFYVKSFQLDAENYLDDCKTVYVDYVDKQAKFLKTLLKAPSKPIKTPKPIVQVSKIEIYSKQAANSNGDVVAHLEENLREKLENDGIINYRYWEGIEAINSFSEEMKKKNVFVFLVFPNHSKKEYLVNKQSIAGLEQDLRKNLDIDILGNAETFVYPNDYFFDTNYHLNKIGRQKRTEDLIKLIKANSNVRKAIERLKVAK